MSFRSPTLRSLPHLLTVLEYFRFLSVQYATDVHTFKREFCDPDSLECQSRIQSLLSYMMIRRTLQDKIFDRPIVELPQTHPEIKKIDFSKEERALYQILEDRFRRDFNKLVQCTSPSHRSSSSYYRRGPQDGYSTNLTHSYFEAGTAKGNYRNIVVKLLRLRQCTAHPFLLRKSIQSNSIRTHITIYQAKR